MTTDRMERVREKAEKAFPYPDDDGITATGRWRQRQGFIAGYEAAMNLTDAEWAEIREKAGRAICHEDDSDPLGDEEYDDIHERAQAGYLRMAEAAMRAVGLRREGE